MARIEDDISAFVEALKSNLPITCNTKGEWRREGRIKSFFRRLLGFEDARIIQIATVVSQALDNLETTPVKFNVDLSRTLMQQRRFSSYLSAASEIQAILRRYHSKKSLNAVNRLSQRVIGLLYRIETDHGGMNPENGIDAIHYSLLQKAAADWKRKQKLIPQQERSLSGPELNKLSETARYPLFAALLLQDTLLQEEFFKWTLRDNNQVPQFIEFPATCRRLKRSYLSARVGYFGGSLLSIKKKNLVSKTPHAGQEKILRLPFESEDGLRAKRISILKDDKMVILRGGRQVTIKKVFEIFSNKNREVGNLEFFGHSGIRNWNSHHLGWWNPGSEKYEMIDLNLAGWWQQLPSFESVTKEKLEKRYALNGLAGNEWLAISRASREHLGAEIDKSHGFMEVAVPQGNGSYHIYDFGKFAAAFPQSVLETLGILADTVVGKIAFPDENIFYSHRQHAGSPFVLSPEKGRELMDLIRLDLLKARSNDIVFQLCWENCAYWPQVLMRKLVGAGMPNMFQTPLVDTKPPQPIGFLLSLLRRLPKKGQWLAIRVLEVVMRTGRGVAIYENGGRIYKCAANSPFRQEYNVFLPARLHLLIMQKQTNGVVWAGIRE